MTSEPPRTSLFALGHPLLGPSRHVRACTTARRSPASTFSVAIHFAMKRSGPCSAALRHSPLFSVEVVHWWSAWYRKLKVRGEDTPFTRFPGPPRSPRSPPVLRTSRTSAVSCPPCAPQLPPWKGSASCV